MKKIVACLLTLILCFSLVLPAYAEVGFTDDISDKPAPEIVPTDDTGSVGVFRNEDDEETGKLTEEDLVLTTLKEAEAAEAAEEATEEEAALLKAYEKLSDKDALLSAQAPSMNAVAAELLGKGYTADAFVVRELFGVSVRGEDNLKALNEDGNKLEVSFQVGVGKDAVITAMAYSDKGWEPLELKNNGDGTVTCTIESACTVALLVPNGQGGGSGSASEGNNGTVSTNGSFVPSISAKDAPSMVINSNGSVGGMVDADGNVLSEVKPGCLVITPVSQAETSEAISPEDAKLLLEVYARLCLPETKLSTEAPAMNAVAEKLLGKKHNADDFVIRDLFDMSFICEEHRNYLPKEGVVFELKFDLAIGADAVITAMAYVDGEWKPVEAVNNGDGTVTCRFDELCPVAFLTSADGTVSKPAGDDEPGTVPGASEGEPGSDAADQESEGSNVLLWSLIGAAAAIALAVLAVFLLRRKKKAKV